MKCKVISHNCECGHYKYQHINGIRCSFSYCSCIRAIYKPRFSLRKSTDGDIHHLIPLKDRSLWVLVPNKNKQGSSTRFTEQKGILKYHTIGDGLRFEAGMRIGAFKVINVFSERDKYNRRKVFLEMIKTIPGKRFFYD